MLPKIITAIPGPKSKALADRLSSVECRNTTYLNDDWPIFWEKAEGVNVWDADGNRFLDMNAGFGVVGMGHGFTSEALRNQSHDLLHAMGDVHPARKKVEFCEKLSRITFEAWGAGKGKCLLGNSGFEAVEAALKTATLATGRSGVLAFDGAYHGLGYGALLGQGISWFLEPFQKQIAKVTQRLAYPSHEREFHSFREQLWKINAEDLGAVLVEPVQGRGGIIVPPREFLAELRKWCDAHGALLILDEIYTGFLRTGKMFACEHVDVIPDLICLGKALAGGFPISVCVGKAEIMDAWPQTHGEALHTSTFLGNPLGCAMALEALKHYSTAATQEMVLQTASYFMEKLQDLKALPSVKTIRGVGLMLGIEMHDPELSVQTVIQLLKEGIIVLPDGPKGEVLALTPPFSISREEVDFTVSKIYTLLSANS